MGAETQIYEVVIQNLRDRMIQKIIVSFSNGWHLGSFDLVLNQLQQGRGKYGESFTILEVNHVGQVSDIFKF